MKISVNYVGRFMEVTFRDLEDEDIRARSGLLDEEAAHDLADELHVVARQLRAGAARDLNQILLPFEQAA
jgi:hypothetical protein